MSDAAEDIPTIQEQDAPVAAAASSASASAPVTPVYIFNQYYWDFIKKVKDYAKLKRDSDENAKHIFKNIKLHYAMFDKMAKEHRDQFIVNHCSAATATWAAYQEAPVDSLLTFFDQESYGATVLFKGEITLGQLHRLIQTIPTAEKFLLHQYYTLFGILCHPDTDAQALLHLMKQFKLNDELKSKLAALPDESALKKPLERLYEVFAQITARAPSHPILDEIEQTSLGKLAKEIMGDINLDDLQPDLLSGGGLMDLLTKGLSGGAMGGDAAADGSAGAGGGGLAKIISSVSQKMISKMSSGEIQQEELLKDALNVAAKLPSMLPGGIGGDLSKMGDMLSMLSGMSGMGMGGGSGSGSSKSKKRGGDAGVAPGGFDLSALMSMMGGMNFGGKTVSKKQMNKPGREGVVKTKLSSEMKRQKMAEKLRKQLDERNASKQ